MSEHTWYSGPATIAGVAFPVVRLRVHADEVNGRILKSWQGTAEIDREQAPEITPEWLATLGLVLIQLPPGRAGFCYVPSMTPINDRTWELKIVGAGPAPTGQ